MTLADAFFGSIGLFVFGSLAVHYYRERKANLNVPMAVRNKR